MGEGSSLVIVDISSKANASPLDYSRREANNNE